MSNSKYKQQPKIHNPMHNSFILPRNTFSPSSKINYEIALSHFQTKATSEYDYTEGQDYDHLVTRYENRIRNLESGYQRSKEQYEESLKNMYKEKIILLNIIAHNQTLVNQFRAKLKIQTGSFKEVEAKYHLILSGVFHAKMCHECVTKISNAELQTSPQEARSKIKMTKEKEEMKKRRMGAVKQYSWMYAPNPQVSVTIKLKKEIFKLKFTIEEMTQDNTKKMAKKNRQIEDLNHQLEAASAPTHRIIICDCSKQEKSYVQLQQSKEKEKKLQAQLIAANSSKDKCQLTLKQANENMFLSELSRLNSKYRTKFF